MQMCPHHELKDAQKPASGLCHGEVWTSCCSDKRVRSLTLCTNEIHIPFQVSFFVDASWKLLSNPMVGCAPVVVLATQPQPPQASMAPSLESQEGARGAAERSTQLVLVLPTEGFCVWQGVSRGWSPPCLKVSGHSLSLPLLLPAHELRSWDRTCSNNQADACSGML